MEKNPKACEPCRRRKIRCNGQTPCNRCDRKPGDCVYRLRTRIRKSAAQRAAAAAAAAAAAEAAAAASATSPNNVAKAPPPPPTPGSDARSVAVAAADGTNGSEQPTPLPASAGHDSPAGFRRDVPEAGEGPTSDSAIYQSIAAVPQRSDVEPIQGGTARLFYGPASQFAFLQQVHRGILSSTSPHGQQDREVQEGGAGLDLFLQRSFFFGTAPRFDATKFHRPASSLFSQLTWAQARVFLERFKAWHAHILPFFTSAELDKMLHHLYNSDETQPSQTKALIVAILALGAIATPQTDVAEELIARAKHEAFLFDDTVSLPMIQFSLLLAEYQTSMGRPNLTYLMLGTASRKAFALGLHREAANLLTRSEDAEKCRTTLWCLYFMESWYSMMVGRESMMKMSDISSPFPENQPFIVTLSRLAYIGEQCSKTIYNTHRYDSLRKLFVAAEDIHTQLRDFANKNGIGSAGLDSSGLPSGGGHPLKLLLHNLYYHTILLTFRPFLVADYALASSPSQDAASAMWLRQACRQATNTAQDCIMYCYSQLQQDEVTRTSRYHGFFLESSCAVLFFDILRHPSKYAYNIEFIQMAITSVNLMIDDEPVTNARNSLKKILRVVEETISKQKIAGTTAATTSGLPAFTDPLLQTAPNPSSLASPVSSFLNGGGQDHTQHQRHHHHQQQQQQRHLQQQQQQQHQHQQHQQQQYQHGTIQFPSLHAPPSSANQLIYFSDLPGSLGGGGGGNNSTETSMGGTPLGMTGTGLGGGGGGGGDADAFGGEGLDPLTHFHYDVLTTDLFSFFPLNMTPPSANGSTAAAADAAAAAAGMGGECPLGNGSPGT